MPRTKLQQYAAELKEKQARPAPNYAADLFRRSMKGQGLSCADLAPAFGITGNAVQQKLARPLPQWRFADIEGFCNALNIPVKDALDAIGRQY